MKNEDNNKSFENADTLQQKCQGCEFYRTKLLHNAIMATMMSDLDALKSALNELEDKSIIEDTRLFSKPTPLYHLSLYNKMVWDPAFWGWEGRDGGDMIKWMKQRTAEVLEFWRKYLGVDEFVEPNYQEYAGSEYLAYDHESDEEILDAKREDFIAQGCREIDIDLYLATHRFEYDRVEYLLQQGANPEAELHCEPEDEEGWYPVDWPDHCIHSEEEWLTEILFPIYEDSFANKDVAIELKHCDLLLGLAAYVKMDKLFEKYRHIWNKG